LVPDQQEQLLNIKTDECMSTSMDELQMQMYSLLDSKQQTAFLDKIKPYEFNDINHNYT